jgi:hypothetical protein
MGITACHPVNDVVKPCAGEPHARIDRGALAKSVIQTGAAGLRLVTAKHHHILERDLNRPDPAIPNSTLPHSSHQA